MKRERRRLSFLLVVVAAACNDPATTDERGYTKAPLEHPTLVIRGEEPAAVSRYGTPNRVVAEELRLPEEPSRAAGGEQPVERPPVALPAGVTEAMVAAGQQVFSGPGACYACHGANGTGSPLAPALNDATWLNLDGTYDALVQTITEGVPAPKQAAIPMAPRGGAPLTDAQVREVAAYVYSISR